MKPFDLEKALAGAPVMLRDGSKALVCAKRPDGVPAREGYDSRKLIGWFEDGIAASWSIDGRYESDDDDIFDIIGMYPVKEKRWIGVDLVDDQTTLVHLTKEAAMRAAEGLTVLDTGSGKSEWQFVEIEVEV
jgi:hypothetical protein